MSFETLKLIRTRSQVNELMMYIDTLSYDMFKIKDISRGENIIEKSLFAEIKDLEKQDAIIYLREMSVRVKSMKIIKLTSGIRLASTTIDKIHLWLENNVLTELILDIEVRPEIVGGLILSFDGKYIDLSLRKKMNEILVTNCETYAKYL